MIHHLAPHGSLALLLANGSMSSNTNNEAGMLQALIEADLVKCMVALPGQLFTNTQLPACIWFRTRSKAGRKGKRQRSGQTKESKRLETVIRQNLAGFGHGI